MRRPVIAIALLALLLGGCPMGRGPMHGHGPGADRTVGGRLPAATPLPEPASAGAALVRRYCSVCHNTPAPGLHSAVEWPAVVARMEARGPGRGWGAMWMAWAGPARPSADERATLLAYLERHALRPYTAPASPDPAAGLFAEVCGQCHLPPDPRQHAAGEWPLVVERMTGHMRSMNRPLPAPGQLERIIRFLDTASRG
jgi:cytochrome c5